MPIRPPGNPHPVSEPTLRSVFWDLNHLAMGHWGTGYEYLHTFDHAFQTWCRQAGIDPDTPFRANGRILPIVPLGSSEEARKESYVTVGGVKTFRTEVQAAEVHGRSKAKVMVIYTDPSDIPPTPKSPA
ncbi:hypothetical protein GE21DRAFT_1867 [Neurospora crassa]|uniref:Uncharacterized protein n=1 Tax=Neurospora crassa (strain ATCC 24698 / 74-OR23-1A / CBS 708.71 / DSM 1257 / FGSC 987) TaxID=367110 RepID=Q7SD97_NEUCR|nr:hypothetical protein NCU00842 [Neurospora crassa OR74A]EAA34726.1 hypothetical protein NCU00842 [Neurospora crassa OR74A]KHE78615.1 hypothetical protein GE21DRAFT_1867 [Neurospora crassa]|eukprot:XP_963962.1 hypothetical protein NCU00842 [Neurospora crassa OR74A]